MQCHSLQGGSKEGAMGYPPPPPEGHVGHSPKHLSLPPATCIISQWSKFVVHFRNSGNFRNSLQEAISNALLTYIVNLFLVVLIPYSRLTVMESKKKKYIKNSLWGAKGDDTAGTRSAHQS